MDIIHEYLKPQNKFENKTNAPVGRSKYGAVLGQQCVQLGGCLFLQHVSERMARIHQSLEK